MQCQEVCQELEAYISGELSERQAAAIDAHLRQCPACSKERKEMEAFGQLLGSTLKAQLEAPVPPAIEQRLRAALAQERTGSRYWRRRGLRAGILQGLGVAAVFLFAVLLTQRGPQGLVAPEQAELQLVTHVAQAPVVQPIAGESAEGLIQLATMLSDRSLRSDQAAIPVEPEAEPAVVYVEVPIEVPVEVPVEVIIEREVPPSRGPSNPADLDEKQDDAAAAPADEAEEVDEAIPPQEGEGEAAETQAAIEPPAWVPEQAAAIEKVEYGNGWVRVAFALPGWPANQASPGVALGNSWGPPIDPNTLEWQMSDDGQLEGKAYFILPGRASHLQIQITLPDRELILPLPQP